MEGQIKVIEGVYPVTRAEAVYVTDGKTLKEAMDDGTIGSDTGSVVTTSNFVTNAFALCGDILFDLNSIEKSIKVSLNLNILLNRIMVVNYSNGTVRQEAIPNTFTLNNKEYMVWNATNGFQIKSQTNGVNIPFDSVLVAINWEGKITGGILFDIFNRRFPLYNKQYSLKFDEKPLGNYKTLHSMFICDDELITLEVESIGQGHVYSMPDLTHIKSFDISLVETNADNSTSELRLVASDYSENARALIMGNSTSTASEEYMKGYIFYEADTWKDATEKITFSTCGKYTRLDFPEELFPGQATAKLCWAAEDDTAYLTTSNLQYVHKILLGKGAYQLEHGTYVNDGTVKYNGTYKIIESYTQDIPKYGNKDLVFYRGALWFPIKDIYGGYRIHKAYLSSDNNSIKYDLIYYNPIGQDGNPSIIGSPEGIVGYNGKIYCAHASYPTMYSFDIV